MVNISINMEYGNYKDMKCGRVVRAIQLWCRRLQVRIWVGPASDSKTVNPAVNGYLFGIRDG